MRCTFLVLFLAYSISGLAQNFGTGLIFDDAGYQAVSKKARLVRGDYLDLPTSASIKKYAPLPGNQIQLNTSVAWATAYSAKTIIEARMKEWTDTKKITLNSFAPSFTYHMIRKDTDEDCTEGAFLHSALESLKTDGAIKYVDFQYFCAPHVNNVHRQKASKHRITDYSRLYDETDTDRFKLKSIKKAILGEFPVVVGMYIAPSFGYAKEFWQPREKFSEDFKKQALCIVGYDDEKHGGAFEVINSWGHEWGNDGYLWIPYDVFLEFVRYAYEVYEVKDVTGTPDLSGEVNINLEDGDRMAAQLMNDHGYYKVIKPYRTGTKFQIVVENEQTAYVYIVGTDKTFQFGSLFPFADQNISALLSYPSTHVAIPDEDYYIEMQDPPGKDFLCIFYSREELNIEDITRKLSQASGDVRERIEAVLGSSLVDMKNVTYGKSEISFSGFSKNKSVIPIIIEIDHI